MVETVELRSISFVLETLAAHPDDQPMLSVHLGTSPGRTVGGAYRIWFREVSSALGERVAGASHTERARFDAAAELAGRHIERQLSPSHPGVAIFSAGTPANTIIVPLPRSPRDLVIWDRHPAIEPLVEALDDAERVAVLLFDKERTRLFTVYLGEIEERHVFVDDVPGKQATGDWFGLSQARYARHHEDHVLRHVKRTIRAVTDELRNHPFDRLYIAGPPEARSMLMHHLPRPLKDRLAGSLSVELFAAESKILTAALVEAEAAERREELVQVQALLEASSAQGAVLGVDATLGVLNEGRVHRIFIASGLDVSGGECEQCQRLVLAEETCPVCGGHVHPVPGVGERATAHALHQGARVEHVSGEAAALLLEHGGMGAWTRY
jgi:peptide chain release factor subunit 1